ncbi:MAG TPA: CehA/McbA family metallohydrolase [Kofleriaceae bacterium]|nr:CehA/McbA family metallohydrolase [Kofleriaceae bacterium]
MRAAFMVAIAVCASSSCTGSAPPHARAQRIGKLEETIGGPHAIGRIGDFLLENDQVRFIIADTGRCSPGQENCSEVYGRVNTTFGGSLVDADLQRVQGESKGNDQLAELLPGIFFTAIGPTKVEILADGSDGGAAIVQVTGTGGDLFQTVGHINAAIVGPMLEYRQTYKLDPGARYVTIETTIKNISTGTHPFPYLQPSQLDNLLGTDIPGIGNLMLSVPVGQLPLFGGEQSIFAPGTAGFNVLFAIQDSYKIAGGFPSFPGMVVDFIATRGKGVSYGLSLPESPDNFVNSYPAGYAGQDITPYSMVLPFSYAGVTGAYQYRAPPSLAAGAEKTYTSYFIVGRGDVGSVYDTILDLRKAKTGSFGGRVVDALSQEPIAGASVIILKAGKVVDQMETDKVGSFLGKLEVGDYTYRVVTNDRPLTEEKMLHVDQGAQLGRLLQVDPPATLAVSVVDEMGRHAPAKIQLIGHDARVKTADGRGILYSLQLGEAVRPTAFDGTDRYIEKAWWTVDGRLEAKVRPGTYDLVISRGPEYELTIDQVTLPPGGLVGKQLQLTRAFSTPGWIAGDFHIHSQPSTDSGLPISERVASCAAEGLEVAVATDHNYITDYAPVIAASGLDPWLLGIPGMELTTFETGHFIGYPLKVDPGSTRGGEFLWAHQTPKQMFDQLRALAVDPNESIVDIAHPRQQVLGYFAQYFVDPATGEPYTPTGIMGLFAPYGDEFRIENFSYDFDALELLTARKFEDVHTFVAPNPLPPPPLPTDPAPVPGQVVVGKDGKPTFPGTVETWFTLLDRGHKATGLGASDTHHLLGDEPGSARTLLFVGEGKDTPGGYSRSDVVTAIKQHHAITTNAPFIEMTVNGQGIGSTVTAAGPVAVEIHVRSPSWAPVDHLKVYTNGGTVAYDMPITTGTDFTTTVNITPTTDAWVVAEVTGTANMFPALSPVEFPPFDATIIIGALTAGFGPALANLPLANNLKPQRQHTTHAYAITNPIWIDRDGNGWTPPKAPLPNRFAPRLGTDTTFTTKPDVRALFDALPEVSQ